MFSLRTLESYLNLAKTFILKWNPYCELEITPYHLLSA